MGSLCGGGGSNSPTSTTVNQQSIPPELMPYATQVLGQAQSLAQTPYQQYQGQQVAGFNPMQTQAMNTIQQMQPSQYTNQAAGLAGMGATNQFTGANVNQYMSPYVNDVIQNQEQGAIRDYARSLPQMAGMAASTGNLGGTRQALVQGEAQRNLQNQLGTIQATGLQNAFQNAQGQFNQQNQNLLAGAGALGNLGQQQYGQQAGIATAQLGAGSQIQQQEQQGLNTSYQNYTNQLNYPYAQLGFESSLIRGTPTGSNTQTMYQAPPSVAGQVAGLGLGLGSLFGATK